MAATSTTGEQNVKTFLAAGTIAAFSRVKLSGGSVVVAGSNEGALGITGALAVVSGEYVNVNLFWATKQVLAGETVALGAACYALASGKVGDTDPGSGTIRYYALQAATADGQVIEVCKYD